VRTGVGATSVRSGPDGSILVELSDGGLVDGSHLLVATGRRPNSDDLGLDTVGVATDARGYIQTDRHFLTSVGGIYAVGDVNGRGAFTHTAYQDYEILADHLAGGDRHVDDRVVTYGLFTDPPLGRVGMTERDARASQRRVGMARFEMVNLTRAVLEGETAGLIKLLVDLDSEEILGAATLGLAGDEIVATISIMMHAGVPYTAFGTWLPIHPVVGEFWPTIIQQIEELG
jgi:pyruvate/2-oxoglutarate dehydrogenase complex dihydrolipoamide dehydrogenase (E3) component